MRRLLAGSLTLVAPVFAQTASAPAAPPEVLRGWRAQTIHRSDGGVWYAHVAKVVDAYAANEVIAADDEGRLLLLTNYSGVWTAHDCVPDGQWLAPSRPADVDPRVPGPELYAGGRGGSVHQVTLRAQPFAKFRVESREIGHAAGEEFHTVLAADLSPEPGEELLAFAISGKVYRLRPAGDDGGFAMTAVADVRGRVRDALVVSLPTGPIVLGVSRRGDLLRMQLRPDGLEARAVLREDSGLGRIAASPFAPDVFYVTRDDGVLLRIRLGEDDRCDREPILATAQGLRGVAAGRFFADGREAVAVYGYGKEVQLAARVGGGPWRVETLMAARQKGHWLTVGELDGRNGTDELLATGFDGEVVVLAREPGYGLPGAAVPVEPDPSEADAGPRAPRIFARIGEQALTELSPLRYQGGFESKSLVYETLVRRDAAGRVVPGLASTWRSEDGGKAFVFTLRDGATFHDGEPVAAEAVATHFRRWVGLPEHDWLRSNRRIVAVRATGPRELRIELDRPWALLPDLCAVNPTAVRGPGALDREGNFVRPVGSGPFAFAGVREGGAVLRYRVAGPGPARHVDLVRAEGDALEALLRGEVDAVVGSWLVAVDPVRAAALRGDTRFVVVDAAGSSMRHLGLRWDRGPLQDSAVRRAVAAAIDRTQLVREVEHGFADPSTGWAAPSIAEWPQGRPAVPATAAVAAPLRLCAIPEDERLAHAVAAQLQRAGLRTEVRIAAVRDGDWDLRIERTHGVPYDPFTTLVSRFAAPLPGANASRPAGAPVDETLDRLVHDLASFPDESSRPVHYARIQARLDEQLPIVPLYACRRIAVVRAGLPLPKLDHDLYRLDADWLAELAR